VESIYVAVLILITEKSIEIPEPLKFGLCLHNQCLKQENPQNQNPINPPPKHLKQLGWAFKNEFLQPARCMLLSVIISDVKHKNAGKNPNLAADCHKGS